MRQILSAFTFLAIAVLLSSFRPLFAQDEFGKAGYYADALHGRRTASGEIYDKNELTCAHKTLPFGTPVRVTRLDNQKSVVGFNTTLDGPLNAMLTFVPGISKRVLNNLASSKLIGMPILDFLSIKLFFVFFVD